MEMLGKILVALSFIGGAYLASLHPTEMNWTWFVPVIAAGVLGAFVVKREQKAAALHGDTVAGHKEDMEASLDNIVANLEKLEAGKADIPTYEMRFEIDKLFREDLNRFADARESMKVMFGLQAYADIMSSFAAGERYINRVWSASTDGYVDEVLAYVTKSLNQFRHARDEYHRARESVA